MLINTSIPSIDNRYIICLLLTQLGLACLLIFEYYEPLVVLIGIMVVIPLVLNRLALSLIIFPLFLYMPFEIVEGSGVQFSKIGLILLFFGGLGTLLLRNPASSFYFPAKSAIGLIFISGLFSMVNARYPVVSLTLLLKLVLVLGCVYLFTVNGLTRINDVRHILFFCVLGGIGAAIAGILRYNTGIEVRVFGMHGGSYGAYIGTAIIIAIVLIYYDRSVWRRCVLIGGLPVLVLALFLSQTRAWTFGTILALLSIIILQKKRKAVLMFFGTVIVLSILLIVFFQLNIFGSNSISTVSYATSQAFETGLGPSDSLGKYVSSLLRVVVWWHGWQWYSNYPILGVGLGNMRFQNMIMGIPGPPNDDEMGFVDNQYLHIWFETGLLGVLGWGWFIWLIFQTGRYLIRHMSSHVESEIIYAVIGMLLLWAYGGMFWVLTSTFESFAMLGLFLGLLFSMKKLIQERIAEQGAVKTSDEATGHVKNRKLTGDK